MKKNRKKIVVPPEREETERRRIMDTLLQGPMGIRDISVRAGISERHIPEHLRHLKKSLRGQGLRLVSKPAKCLECGFSFAKRERVSKPGRCPVCKGSRVAGPEFFIE